MDQPGSPSSQSPACDCCPRWDTRPRTEWNIPHLPIPVKQRKPFLSSSSSRLVVKTQSAGCGLLRILLLRLFVLARAEGNVELFWDLHCRAFWSLITVTLSCSGFWPLLQPYTDVLPGALPLGDAGVCEHRADPATSQVVSWHQGWEVHGYLSFPACANPF